MQTMRLFRRFGGSVVLVTDRAVSPLLHLADVPLVVHSEGGAGMFGSRAAGVALIEALLAALMPRCQNGLVGRIEKIENAFTAIDAFVCPETGRPAATVPTERTGQAARRSARSARRSAADAGPSPTDAARRSAPVRPRG